MWGNHLIKGLKASLFSKTDFDDTLSLRAVFVTVLASNLVVFLTLLNLIYLYSYLFIFFHLDSFLFTHIFFSLPELLQLQMMTVVAQFIQRLFAKSIQIWLLIKCYVQELQVVVLILAKEILEVNHCFTCCLLMKQLKVDR